MVELLPAAGPFLSHFAHGIAAAHLGFAPGAHEHLTRLRSLMPAVEEEGKYTNVPGLKVCLGNLLLKCLKN